MALPVIKNDAEQCWRSKVIMQYRMSADADPDPARKTCLQVLNWRHNRRIIPERWNKENYGLYE